MHHQFGIFAASAKIRSRSGPRPAPFSHSASAADEISASAGAASSASRKALNASADEFGLRQFLAMALDQRRMAKRNRKDHDLARRQARLAAELALRRQGRFREADARAARGKRPAAPWDEGLFRTGVASRRPLAFVAEERRKAPLHVRLVMAAQRLVGDFPDRLAEAALERRALLGRIEALAVGFAHEQHVGERPRVLEMLGHRRRAA